MHKTELIEFIELLTKESGPLISEYFAHPNLKVETKADNSPITIADRQAEAAMRALIRQHYPEHGIMGEEFATENGEAPYLWVLDPIDGTKPFTLGCPLFGTLICLLKEGQPILGAIHNPLLKQLLIGDNRHTTLNRKPVKIKDTNDLSKAILLTSNLRHPAQYQNGWNWDQLVDKVRELFTWGDCYGYLLVATGRADIMVDPILHQWDLLALIPIIRGAGGIITDWEGNDPVKGNSIVAANPHLHPQVIEILNASS